MQKAHYKTGNVRKLEAAIRLYGGLIEVYPPAAEKLTSMLLHPFPKIRNQVADTLSVLLSPFSQTSSQFEIKTFTS